jgi:ADP-heptose:LPS heptosyltransferase
MKFLVIRFSSIGDIVLTTPVIRCLKVQMPTAEIHFVTKEGFRPVVQNNPYIDRIHSLGASLDELIEQLKAEEFDYVIDLHNNLRSGRIRRALGIEACVVKKENLKKFLLIGLRFRFIRISHITQRSLETVKRFGIVDDGKGVEYYLSESDKVKETDIPASHHAGYIAIVIGASYSTKRLPLHQLRRLCAAIEHPVILLGGKEEKDLGDTLALEGNGKVYNACGKFTLNESADLVRRAKLVISHDTGLQHIAAAFRKRVLAIWGSTSPVLGLEPYYGTSVTPDRSPYTNIIVPGMLCQPCSKHGRHKCPLGHFNCMNKQDVEAIAALAMKGG